jgi:electron transfer flavoprotein beta subunit
MATFAKSIEVSDGTVKINRQTEKGYDVVECPLPAVVTVTAGVNEPRYPSFKGIVEAKRKPVDQLSLGDLGLSLDSAASQSVAGINDAPKRGAGEVVEDEGTGAQKIADFLGQAKVI